VKAVDKAGKVTVIACAQQTPRALALDTNYVYWATQGDGTIHRASKFPLCR
jgi:hypothetical protein